MSGFSKREIILFTVGMLMAGVLTAWLTVVGVNHYLDSTRANDPLAKPGGPKISKAVGSDK